MPEPTTSAAGLIRFGVFEVDLRAGELRKNGSKVRLEGQPFEILSLLLEQPGQLVTREELKQKLWPSDTFVDFDHSINVAVKRLREALNDSAETPRYVETLPRRGYRFIYPVDGAPSIATARPPALWWRARWAFGLLGIVALLGILLAANVGGLRERILGARNVGPIVSVAVLPCKNLTGDPGQEFLADGLTDVLTTQLAQVKSLTVPSVTSAMYFKGEHKRLSEIARELRVQAMVEPSVQRSRDRLLVNLQLIHAPTDRHLWAKSYEVDPRNVQALLPAVAREILEAMNVQVTLEEKSRLSRSQETTPEAYEAYMKGRYHFRKGTEADREKAAQYFGKAIEIDQRFGPPYAMLAILHSHGGLARAGGGGEGRRQAREWATKALELDSTLAEAHTALAWADNMDWDWRGAEQNFKRAIELNPNYSTARTWYAQFLGNMCRFEESFEQAERAMELDPASPPTVVHAVIPYWEAGRIDEAIAKWEKLLEMEPNYFWTHHWLGRAYTKKGMHQQAIAHLQKSLSLSGRDPVDLGVLAYAYAQAGQREEAMKIVRELEDRFKRGGGGLRHLAHAYTGLGEKDKAFTVMESAFERRAPWLITINSEPLFDPLRSDPRFQDLMRRVGLPQPCHPGEEPQKQQ